MGKIVGIDLGTTNSCIAIYDDGGPVIISSREGSRTTPSIVAFTERGDRIVGHIAKRQANTNPQNTFYAVKRFIGKKFNDPQIQGSLKNLPYSITAASNGDIKFVAGDKDYTAQELSAMVLKKMKDSAEAYLEENVTEAVITVPAYFDDAQRQATKDAGRIAGLDVKRIINEPTAAALSYGLESEEGKKIAVYDLGGGTFDISILMVNKGVCEVLSTSGDTYLGGEDFDRKIVDFLIKEFQNEHGADLRESKMALQRLNEEAEKAKCDLSSIDSVDINLPFIHSSKDGKSLHLKTVLSRASFEDMISDLVVRTEAPCKDALAEAGLTPAEIDEVLLVGGQTRTPLVQKTVEHIFGKKPNVKINPDEVVAMGAAIQAGVLQGEVKDIVLLDVTPLTLGIETQGGMSTEIIPRNSSVPTKKSRTFTTVHDNQSTVEINVLQGESKLANRNRSLGKFELRDIPPAPRGMPEIWVTFAIDSNGIVNVSAVDVATNKAQSISIQPSSGLTEEEIDKIINEAEQHSDEEEKRAEFIRMKSRLENLYLQNKKSFDEFGGLLNADERDRITESLRAAEKALKGDSLSDTNDAMDALKQVSKTLINVVL